MWGYASFHAIARGVVTPKDDNKIVLFVTEEKTTMHSNMPIGFRLDASTGKARQTISPRSAW